MKWDTGKSWDKSGEATERDEGLHFEELIFERSDFVLQNLLQ